MITVYKSLSRWSVAAFAIFGLNLLFHVIAFCLTEWFWCTWRGRETRVGLWQGCWHNNKSSEEICTDSLFDSEEFNPGKNRKWISGSQVLMTCSLLVLVSLELVLICYVCIVKLAPYGDRMAGMLVGMSLSEVPITGIVLLMMGSEVTQLENGSLSWGYGLEVICLVLSIIMTVLIYINRQILKNKRDMRKTLANHEKEVTSSGQYDNHAYVRERRRDSTEYSGSAYTSDFKMSSTNLGTFEHLSSRSTPMSDITRSTNVVSYSTEPSRRSSFDTFPVNTQLTETKRSGSWSGQLTNIVSQSPDPLTRKLEKNIERTNSRNSSSSIESVV